MTYIRNPYNPFMWESDGEYNDKFRADDGTLHDSANAAVKHNEQMRNEIQRQKFTSKMNTKELGVGLTQPTPPVKERASDEQRAEEWREAHLVHRKLLPAIVELIAETRATAAKLAREEALEEAAKICDSVGPTKWITGCDAFELSKAIRALATVKRFP